jgi:hypothetical protein
MKDTKSRVVSERARRTVKRIFAFEVHFAREE